MIPKVELKQEPVQGPLPVVKRDSPQNHFDALVQLAERDGGFRVPTDVFHQALREGCVEPPGLVGRQRPFDGSPDCVAPELVPEDVLRDAPDIDLECLLPRTGETTDHPASVGNEALHDVLRKIVEGARIQAPASREPRTQHDPDEAAAPQEQDSPQGVIRTRRYEAAKQLPGVHEMRGRGSLFGCPGLRTTQFAE